MNKELQMVDDLVDLFSEVDHFMDKCLKFKHERGTVISPHKEVCKVHAEEGKAIDNDLFLY